MRSHSLDSASSPYPVSPSPYPTPPPRNEPSPHTRLPGVALQNSDPATGAVIITSFPVPPFCCHEDLITMSRTQLEGVAHTMNARLPGALRIDVGPHIPDVEIRHAIELLV
ncbi:hypothetical protein BJ138DRAFT_997726, partial [Hygrophoropsis aurantiaca]